MANDTPVSKKYRILKNESTDTWDRVSFLTKASDVYFSDGTSAQELKPINILRRNSLYSNGDVVFEKTAPSHYMFKCVVNGITAATTPSDYANAFPGALITDGTAQFRVYDKKSSATLTNLYSIPSLRAVYNEKSKLIADDDTQFYFGKYDGEYGFFTSEDRTSQTFHPFHYGYTRFMPSLSYSVSISPGESEEVDLYAPINYKWKELGIIQILGDSPLSYPSYVWFHVTEYFDLDPRVYAGWASDFDERLEITSHNANFGDITTVTFKNNDSTTRTVTPCCIWGYLESST